MRQLGEFITGLLISADEQFRLIDHELSHIGGCFWRTVAMKIYGIAPQFIVVFKIQ